MIFGFGLVNAKYLLSQSCVEKKGNRTFNVFSFRSCSAKKLLMTFSPSLRTYMSNKEYKDVKRLKYVSWHHNACFISCPLTHSTDTNAYTYGSIHFGNINIIQYTNIEKEFSRVVDGHGWLLFPTKFTPQIDQNYRRILIVLYLLRVFLTEKHICLVK